MFNSNSEHTKPPREFCPGPAPYCNLTGNITKITPLFYQSWLLQGDRKPGKKKNNKTAAMNSMNMGWSLHFFYCEMNFLIRVSTGWNTRIVDGAFDKSTGNSLGRRIRNPYAECLFNEKKVLSLSWWQLSQLVNVLQGSYLITPRKGVISAVQCWFVYLENWEVNTSLSQIECHCPALRRGFSLFWAVPRPLIQLPDN